MKSEANDTEKDRRYQKAFSRWLKCSEQCDPLSQLKLAYEEAGSFFCILSISKFARGVVSHRSFTLPRFSQRENDRARNTCTESHFLHRKMSSEQNHCSIKDQ